MPYVTDIQNARGAKFDCAFADESRTYALSGIGITKRQYGWRTGSLTPIERESIKPPVKDASWWQTVSVAQDLEREYEYTSHRSTVNVVNDRTYQENGKFYAPIPWFYTRSSPDTAIVSGRGVLTVGFTGGNVPAWYGLPSLEQQRTLAAPTLRALVPTRPAFRLLRFLGEQKDTPQIFRVANYLPRNPKQAAGAFLNLVFGVKPEISDIRTLAETVHGSVPLMRDFIAHSQQSLRRSGVRYLHRDSIQATTKLTGDYSLPYRWQTDVSYIEPSGPDTNSGAGIWISFANSGGMHITCEYDVSVEVSLATFATFEYFVPRPSGLASRLEMYEREASRLIGADHLASDIFDLTPWTWLVDWFADIGGLITFQETMNSNDVVMRRSGSTWRCKASAACRLIPGPTKHGWSFSHSQSRPALTNARYERREAGGPYNLDPTASLTTMQGIILAALGISHSR